MLLNYTKIYNKLQFVSHDKKLQKTIFKTYKSLDLSKFLNLSLTYFTGIFKSQAI